MATYADLKARIIAETRRDDLGDDLSTSLDTHVSDACEAFADMRFWFNQIVQSADTVADVGTVGVPVAMRIVDRVAGPYTDLVPLILEAMPDWGDNPQSGLPSKYAYLDGNLTFDVTPDAVYGLTLYGLMQIDPPALDADSNAWTNEAAALISAQTRMTLYRDLFRDEGGEAAASRAADAQLYQLRRETERRLRPRAVAQLVRPNGQPVRSAWLDRF